MSPFIVDDIANTLKEKFGFSVEFYRHRGRVCCELNDGIDSIVISITRECIVSLPRVRDFRTCPACLMKHRANRRQLRDYCWPCKQSKLNLGLKGITEKSMRNNMDAYNSLVGSMTLLKELKRTLKRENNIDVKENGCGRG